MGCKFYDHSLIPSLDDESKVCWRPYGVTHRGLTYDSVMSGFRDIEAQDYTLIAEDVRSLTFLSATNAGWLPVLSSSSLQFTAYCPQGKKTASEIPTINPFLKTRAFAYWSGVAPKVVIPSGNRVVFIPLL